MLARRLRPDVDRHGGRLLGRPRLPGPDPRGRPSHADRCRQPDDRLAREPPALRGTTRTTPCPARPPPRRPRDRRRGPTRARTPAGDEHAERLRRRLHAHVVERRGPGATAGATPAWSARRSSTTPGSPDRRRPPRYTDYYVGSYGSWSFTFAVLQQEIDAGAADGPLRRQQRRRGQPTTPIAGIGYRETNGYPEYACWDTWNATAMRWQRSAALLQLRMGDLGRDGAVADRLRQPTAGRRRGAARSPPSPAPVTGWRQTPATADLPLPAMRGPGWRSPRLRSTVRT